MNEHKYGWGTVCALIASVAIIWSALLILTPVQGHAAQPYGGCKEAWQVPTSRGADDCRAKGWTVQVNLDGHGIVVDPHAVVRYVDLPMCRYEDGSGQRSACTWNLGPRTQGNGLGASYWVDTRDRIHYVWPMHRMTGWNTVTPWLADVIAESDLPAHRWERWRYRVTDGNLWLASPAGTKIPLF